MELDHRHLPALRARFAKYRAVTIEHADFLAGGERAYDFIIGNPPYVAITSLSESEKIRYRSRYDSARGRFDLYMLFFEESLRRLSPGGRLVLITPEKYLYVESAGPLRDLLTRWHVESVRLMPEDTFGDLVAYPTVTVVNHASGGLTLVAKT
jgi:type I restriction-modification system DNA methylase subunit